jgi:Co/Zn/Cd efflux system component
MNPSDDLTAEIRQRFAGPGERVLDLHLWKLGPGHHAAVLVIEAAQPLSPQAARARIADIVGLSHVTVEVRGPALKA